MNAKIVLHLFYNVVHKNRLLIKSLASQILKQLPNPLVTFVLNHNQLLKTKFSKLRQFFPRAQ